MRDGAHSGGRSTADGAPGARSHRVLLYREGARPMSPAPGACGVPSSRSASAPTSRVAGGQRMRFHTYSKFSPEMADAVDLQSLLDKLADFLLQSGFAGGKMQHPYWGEFGDESDHSLDALRDAILRALMDSGQFTPEMLEALRGDGDSEDDGEAQAKLAKLLDDIVQRLVSEGYLNLEAPPQMPANHQEVTGPGGLARAASRDVQFSLTEKGIDFLGFKTLRHLLGSLGKSSFGSHDTPYLATGVEADGSTKTYEFGDTLNLDVNETLQNALIRNGSLDVPIDLD